MHLSRRARRPVKNRQLSPGAAATQHQLQALEGQLRRLRLQALLHPSLHLCPRSYRLVSLRLPSARAHFGASLVGLQCCLLLEACAREASPQATQAEGILLVLLPDIRGHHLHLWRGEAAPRAASGRARAAPAQKGEGVSRAAAERRGAAGVPDEARAAGESAHRGAKRTLALTAPLRRVQADRWRLGGRLGCRDPQGRDGEVVHDA
mmetsp:Transcript_26120/g.45901  ORF Transcript_26120/g.45901 Transcript_26120/m.45901 type:complete len:207 (-) Transcript_26120:334-954(-)